MTNSVTNVAELMDKFGVNNKKYDLLKEDHENLKEEFKNLNVEFNYFLLIANKQKVKYRKFSKEVSKREETLNDELKKSKNFNICLTKELEFAKKEIISLKEENNNLKSCIKNLKEEKRKIKIENLNVELQCFEPTKKDEVCSVPDIVSLKNKEILLKKNIVILTKKLKKYGDKEKLKSELISLVNKPKLTNKEIYTEENLEKLRQWTLLK